jgi:hypothetical protein
MASRAATRRVVREGTPPPSAFARPLLLAAGLLQWDGMALKVVPRARPRHGRRGGR